MTTPMPTLSEGHKRLELFVGNWAGVEKMYPSPWDPDGGTAVARVQNHMILHGFAVMQDYEQERVGAVNLRGHGVIVWNQETNNYEFHWFSSMGTPPTLFTGQFEAGVFTLVNKGPAFHSRAIFDFRDQTQYVFKLDTSENGDEWAPFMHGEYKQQLA